MKPLLIAALAIICLPLGVQAGDGDTQVVKPEVVEGQPPANGEVDHARERLPGNDRPGPATEAIEKTKEASGHAWEATKKGASDAADYTSEKATQAWEATKEGTEKAVDWTKEKTGQAWEATKETAGQAGDAVKSGYGKAKEKTQKALGND